MENDNEIAISKAVSDIALLALENGMASRRDGAILIPFVLIESGGHCYVRRCGTRDDAVEEASAFLCGDAGATSAYALAYDGTVTVEGTAFDAILVIAGEQGAPDAFVFTQRYDAAAAPVTLIGSPALIGQHDSLDKAT